MLLQRRTVSQNVVNCALYDCGSKCHQTVFSSVTSTGRPIVLDYNVLKLIVYFLVGFSMFVILGPTVL